MKKEEIEWEDVPLNDNDVKIAQYKLDESKLQILEKKNKLELNRHKIDNNVSKSISRNLIRLMKRDLIKFEDDLKKLSTKEPSKDCELTEEQKSDKKTIIEFTIKECKQKIEETELNIKYNLNARQDSQTIGDTEDGLKLIESNMKVYHNMVRNKTRKVVKPRVQLSEETQ